MQQVSEFLADDYVLGNLVHSAGYRVVLSEHIIEHHVINRSLWNSLAHQVRWAKSTRRSRPKGHFGSGLTYAMPFALLGAAIALLQHQPLLAAAFFSAGMLNRIVQCLVVGAGIVRDPRSRTGSLLYPLRDLLGFLLWAASFLGNSDISWRGVRYRIQPGGRVIPLTAVASFGKSGQSAA